MASTADRAAGARRLTKGENQRRAQRDRQHNNNDYARIHAPILDRFGSFTYLPRPWLSSQSLPRPTRASKRVSKTVERVDEGLRRFIDDMIESMYEADGIGLAAMQIGVPKRVIVMDLDQKDEKAKPLHFINPVILWASDEKSSFDEGCLSVPEIWDDVEPPPRVSRSNISTATARNRRSKPTGCSPPACSTRWIISKACCSSIISPSSSAPWR